MLAMSSGYEEDMQGVFLGSWNDVMGMSSGYEDDVLAMSSDYWDNAKGMSSGYWTDALLELAAQVMRMMRRV